MTIYINYRLLSLSYDKYPSEISRKYLAISSIVLLLMIVGFIYLIITGGYITNFNQIKELLTQSKSDIKYYIATTLIIIPIFYTLGLAPFHSLIEDKIGKSILPVSHYFSIILPITFWGVLLKLKQTLLLPFEDSISFVLVSIAVFSILLGAIGANARINLYRIFAYGSMYHFGVCVLMLSFFTHQADFGMLIYLIMYLLALNGSYTVFYNLKSRGEFLSE
jgi:NADH-quinone oxidoreductase subunit N